MLADMARACTRAAAPFDPALGNRACGARHAALRMSCRDQQQTHRYRPCPSRVRTPPTARCARCSRTGRADKRTPVSAPHLTPAGVESGLVAVVQRPCSPLRTSDPFPQPLAKLFGVPAHRDSGTLKGKRGIFGWRAGARHRYMAALVAVRWQPEFTRSTTSVLAESPPRSPCRLLRKLLSCSRTHPRRATTDWTVPGYPYLQDSCWFFSGTQSFTSCSL